MLIFMHCKYDIEIDLDFHLYKKIPFYLFKLHNENSKFINDVRNKFIIRSRESNTYLSRTLFS